MTGALSDAFEAFANPDPAAPPVTLIRPSIIFSASNYSMPLALPIGAAYLAAALQRARYRVELIDCVGADICNIRPSADGRFKIQGCTDDELLRRIDPTTDIVGISIMFSQEWPHVRRIIEKIRAHLPGAVIIVGGEHATAVPEFTLRDCPAIDYVVQGEGEQTLVEMVHRLRTQQPLDAVPGVCRLVDGAFQDNRLAPRITAITDMPWPAWELIDLEPYFRPAFTSGIAQGRNMAMLATRGCPYQCTFCSSPAMWTTRYVMRPVTDVVDEIEHNIRAYRANSIDFYDLTAIVKKAWIVDFARELSARGLDVVWQLPSGTRSEVLDEEVLAGVAGSGLKFLVYAPESGSPRVLEMIKKRVSLEKMTASVAVAKRHGLIVKVNFIVGFPDERRADVWRTLRFAWKLALMRVDDCNISLFSPYPGSELYRELRDEGRIDTLNDGYFENLMVQFDFAIVRTFCRHMGSLELLAYRILGMSVFYALSYLRSPSRLLRLLRLVSRRGRDAQPASALEQRIVDSMMRRQAA